MENIMLNNIKQVMTDDQGATMVEYGLIVSLIAVACFIVVGTLGTTIKSAFTAASTAIAPAVG
jgi:pilus assembly protein Flp/PilA